MFPYRHVRMELQTSREVQEYLAHNDLVILPVGCFEMHGPLVPLGCDGFHAWAQGIILADTWKCLTLPPVFYTFPGASGPWPGTVEISTRATQDYVGAVVEALLRNGFRRVVLCGSHGPLRPVFECLVRDLFTRTGQIALHLNPRLFPREEFTAALGYPPGEDAMTLASLRLLGWHGAYDPQCAVEKWGDMPFESLAELRKWDVALPWTFNRDYQHTGLRACLKLEDADKIIAVMTEAAAAYAGLPAAFARYQQDMAALHEEAPWKRAEVWTETREQA
jgi:hypothetical protein